MPNPAYVRDSLVIDRLCCHRCCGPVYLQYELYTTTYMLEWWEKCIISQQLSTASIQLVPRSACSVCHHDRSVSHTVFCCAVSLTDALLCTLIVASNYMAYHFLFKGWKHGHDDVPLVLAK